MVKCNNIVCDLMAVLQVVVYFHPDMPHHVIAYHLTVTLSSLNSCMDPVVYCFVTNNFKVTGVLSFLTLLYSNILPLCHLSISPSILPSSHNLFIHHSLNLLFTHRFTE